MHRHLEWECQPVGGVSTNNISYISAVCGRRLRSRGMVMGKACGAHRKTYQAAGSGTGQSFLFLYLKALVLFMTADLEQRICCSCVVFGTRHSGYKACDSASFCEHSVVSPFF